MVVKQENSKLNAPFLADGWKAGVWMQTLATNLLCQVEQTVGWVACEALGGLWCVCRNLLLTRELPVD